jgi:hypothetical protein
VGQSIQKMFGVAALSLVIVSSGVAMERAASIEYETVERPANLQPDFIAPSDANLRFLAIKAIDGSRVDAVIRPQPRQHLGPVLCRKQLGPGHKSCGADRNVRQSSMEITSHVGAKRGELR